jgi:hypothetical protein
MKGGLSDMMTFPWLDPESTFYPTQRWEGMFMLPERPRRAGHGRRVGPPAAAGAISNWTEELAGNVFAQPAVAFPLPLVKELIRRGFVGKGGVASVILGRKNQTP